MSEKKRKIGILTFSYSSNPGSVLQAWALQKTVSSIEGCEAFIINYRKTDADRPVFGKNIFFGSLRSWTIRKILSWFVRWVAYPIRMDKYKKFFKKYYRNDPRESIKKEALSVLSRTYDAFVVGSDQVWNFDSINVDTTYFLDFVEGDVRKVSYAASFGRSGIAETKKDTVVPLINDFSAISVREKDSVDVLNEITDIPVEWVLDPSLLIDEEWYSMAVKPEETDYVFLYLRENSDRLEEFARKLAEKQGLKVIKVITHWKCDANGKKKAALGPLEWLGYMKHSKYVVTNSFHGICFSVVFRREFFVDLLKGDRAFTNPRIFGVLEQFGLLERCIDEIDLTNISLIDYQAVESIRESRKKHSLLYLKNALKEVDNEE